MKLHFVLNHGETPESKLADVEIHFEEGLLAGTKLVGFGVWRSRKGEEPSVLIPSRSYATVGGVRYYELLRPSVGDGSPKGPAWEPVKELKRFIREEYLTIVADGRPEGRREAK